MRKPARQFLTTISALIGLGLPGAAFAAPPAGASPEGPVEIDRLEVTGVTVLERGDVEGALELTAGDVLERAKVVRTAENLQELYRIHGYEEVRVRSELVRQKSDEGVTETVLRFSIREGGPTRIASVRLIPETMRSGWGKLEAELLNRSGLNAGDILDQEKLAAAKRAVQDSLASEEFVGVRADDVRVSTVEPPANAPGGKDAAARWAGVEFHIDLGDRVTFGFRGNTVFTKGYLHGLVEEQRVLGFGKDYVGAIRARIEDDYRNTGYANVQVTSYTYERRPSQERHVSYEIDEGPRVQIESVDFDGDIIFSNEQLREEFYARASPVIQRRFYVEKEAQKAAELVIEWLKSQGYLASKLVTINRLATPRKKSVRLIVYLYEGDQTVIQSIRLGGIHVISPEEVKRYLSIQEGAPLNLFSFNEGLEALKAAYRAHGYLGVKILNEGTDSVVRYTQENRLADVAIEVDEGPQYRVSRIEIEGLTKTQEEIIRRELAFHPNDVLEEPRITESEARLRKLGVFSVVTIRALDDPDRVGQKIVRVSVQEGTPGVVAGGFGYRNDLGVRVFGQTGYSNLMGRNHTVSFTANANRRFDEDFCSKIQPGDPRKGTVTGNCFPEYQLQLAYTWPWFASPWFSLGETTFRPRITVDRTKYITFDASTIAAAATFERRLLRTLPLTGVFTYSLERTNQFNAQATVDNQILTIGAVIPSLRLDLRDNPLAPTSGLFSSASFEIASPSLLSQSRPIPVGYTRFQTRSDYFVPVAREITWYLSFRLGIERNTQVAPAGTSEEDSRKFAIPLIKQFALGGAGSLRGFGEQELNVQDLAIRGTATYVNYRTQIDLPFAGPLRFGPFLDAANLLVDRFSFGILRYGAGLGFHYQSPVGPVNFDWGFKVDPRPGEDPQRFYFSIGII